MALKQRAKTKMASINKLSIRGVRAFNPEDEEQVRDRILLERRIMMRLAVIVGPCIIEWFSQCPVATFLGVAYSSIVMVVEFEFFCDIGMP